MFGGRATTVGRPVRKKYWGGWKTLEKYFRGAAGKLVEQQQGVYEYVTFGMILRRLLDPFHVRDLRQDFAQQAAGIEQFERSSSRA